MDHRQVSPENDQIINFQTTKNQKIMYEVKITNQKEKKVVGLVLHTTFAENKQAQEIPPFFHKIMEEDTLENVPNRINENQICVFVMKKGSPNFDYYMGVEVSSYETIPEGMETITIPASSFAAAPFIKRGNPDGLKAFKHLTENWLPEKGYILEMGVPMFIYYDERFIPSFKDHGYDGTQIAEMNIPVEA